MITMMMTMTTLKMARIILMMHTTNNTVGNDNNYS